MPIPNLEGIDQRILSDRLLKLTEALPFPCFRLKQGKLHAAEVVGCIQVGGIRINILPKLDTPEPGRDRDFLLNVLRAAGYLNHSYAESAMVRDSARDPIEALISEVVFEMMSALKQSIPRRYEEKCEDSTALRGRIDFTKLSTRLPSGQAVLPILYSPLSIDNAVSRFIKWIASSLFGLTQSSLSRQALVSILAQMTNVQSGYIGKAQIENLVLSRSEARWTKSIAIGRLLLKGHFPDPTFSGQNDAFSVLFPLQHLFERAMRKILANAINDHAFQVAHRTAPLFLLQEPNSHNGILRLKPDYVIYDGPKFLAIADAKWKRLSERLRAHGIDRADLYQINAYLMRYKVQNAIIFVPWANWMSAGWSKCYNIPDTGSSVHLVGVDFEKLVSHKKNTREDALTELSSTLSKILVP